LFDKDLDTLSIAMTLGSPNRYDSILSMHCTATRYRLSMPRLGWSGQTGETDRLRRSARSTRSQHQGKCAKHGCATVGGMQDVNCQSGVAIMMLSRTISRASPHFCVRPPSAVSTLSPPKLSSYLGPTCFRKSPAGLHPDAHAMFKIAYRIAFLLFCSNQSAISFSL
jgi:hypothetical protein